MKQFLLFAATVLVTLGTISQAQAKKPEDQEFRRVIVTLTSGEKVDGYLQRSWHAESSVLKKENYSFKLAKTPDDMSRSSTRPTRSKASNTSRRPKPIRTASAGKPSISLLPDSRTVIAHSAGWSA